MASDILEWADLFQRGCSPEGHFFAICVIPRVCLVSFGLSFFVWLFATGCGFRRLLIQDAHVELCVFIHSELCVIYMTFRSDRRKVESENKQFAK